MNPNPLTANSASGFSDATEEERKFRWNSFWRRDSKPEPILHKNVVRVIPGEDAYPDGVPCHLIEDDPCILFHKKQNPKSPELPILFTQQGQMELDLANTVYRERLEKVKAFTKLFEDATAVKRSRKKQALPVQLSSSRFSKEDRELEQKLQELEVFLREKLANTKKFSRDWQATVNESFYRHLFFIVSDSVKALGEVLYCNAFDRALFFKKYEEYFCEYNPRRRKLNTRLFYTGKADWDKRVFMKPSQPNATKRDEYTILQKETARVEIKAMPVCYWYGLMDAVLYRAILEADNIPFSRFMGYMDVYITDGPAKGPQEQFYFTMEPLDSSGTMRMRVLASDMDSRVQNSYTASVIFDSYRSIFPYSVFGKSCDTVIKPRSKGKARPRAEQSPKPFVFNYRECSHVVSRLVDKAELVIHSTTYWQANSKATGKHNEKSQIAKAKKIGIDLESIFPVIRGITETKEECPVFNNKTVSSGDLLDSMDPIVLAVDHSNTPVQLKRKRGNGKEEASSDDDNEEEEEEEEEEDVELSLPVYSDEADLAASLSQRDTLVEENTQGGFRVFSFTS
jgi:hypothetical protein